MKAEARGDAGPAIPENPELRAEAAEVLAHGDPLSLMLTAFAQEHIGDEILARCLILYDGIAGREELGRTACLGHG